MSASGQQHVERVADATELCGAGLSDRGLAEAIAQRLIEATKRCAPDNAAAPCAESEPRRQSAGTQPRAPPSPRHTPKKTRHQRHTKRTETSQKHTKTINRSKRPKPKTAKPNPKHKKTRRKTKQNPKKT